VTCSPFCSATMDPLHFTVPLRTALGELVG